MDNMAASSGKECVSAVFEISIARESLQHYPECARPAVLVAAGHGQRGNQEKLQQFIRLAQDWGCLCRLINQVLISGVQNSLGLASLVVGQTDRTKFFLNSQFRPRDAECKP
jgi:hypothetical protein